MIQGFCVNHWDSVFSVVTVFCFSVKNRGNKLLEKEANIKFLVKLEKNATEIYKLQQVYRQGKIQVLVCVRCYP